MLNVEEMSDETERRRNLLSDEVPQFYRKRKKGRRRRWAGEVAGVSVSTEEFDDTDEADPSLENQVPVEVDLSSNS
jgi:hypothetical protein